MLNTNMWSTLYLILLSLTWIFRPTLAVQVKKSGSSGMLDVTFPSGEIKRCEKYEISVQLKKEEILAKDGIEYVNLNLHYQSDSNNCSNIGNYDYQLLFNEDLVFAQLDIVNRHINPGAIEYNIEGDKVKYTMFKFKPHENRLDICLTLRVQVQLKDQFIPSKVSIPVKFQKGSETCEPPQEKCQYKNEYKDDGFHFDESSPRRNWTCTCKNDDKEYNCEKTPNPKPYIYGDEEPDTPETTEAPKEGGMMMVYIVAGVIGLVVIGGATYFLFFKKGPAQTTANEGANSGNELQGPNEQLSQKEQESVASKGGPVSQASGAEGKLVESHKSGSPKTSSGSAGTGSS